MSEDVLNALAVILTDRHALSSFLDDPAAFLSERGISGASAELISAVDRDNLIVAAAAVRRKRATKFRYIYPCLTRALVISGAGQVLRRLYPLSGDSSPAAGFDEIRSVIRDAGPDLNGECAWCLEELARFDWRRSSLLASGDAARDAADAGQQHAAGTNSGAEPVRLGRHVCVADFHTEIPRLLDGLEQGYFACPGHADTSMLLILRPSMTVTSIVILPEAAAFVRSLTGQAAVSLPEFIREPASAIPNLAQLISSMADVQCFLSRSGPCAYVS